MAPFKPSAPHVGRTCGRWRCRSSPPPGYERDYCTPTVSGCWGARLARAGRCTCSAAPALVVDHLSRFVLAGPAASQLHNLFVCVSLAQPEVGNDLKCHCRPQAQPFLAIPSPYTSLVQSPPVRLAGRGQTAMSTQAASGQHLACMLPRDWPLWHQVLDCHRGEGAITRRRPLWARWPHWGVRYLHPLLLNTHPSYAFPVDDTTRLGMTLLVRGMRGQGRHASRVPCHRAHRRAIQLGGHAWRGRAQARSCARCRSFARRWGDSGH